MTGQPWADSQSVVVLEFLHEQILVQDTTLEELPATMKPLLAPVSVKNRVFMLNYDGVLISALVRHGEQAVPIEFGESGQSVAPPVITKNTDPLDTIFENLRIFGV